MTTRLTASLRNVYAAALCALALLAFAQVRSTVMQAADAAPGAICDMSGMAGPDRSAPGKAHGACQYCAAAAHAPLLASAPQVRTPSAVVWSPAPSRRTPGARGPPAFRSRARDPPPTQLTA